MDNLKSEFEYYARVDGETKLVKASASVEDYRNASRQGKTFKQLINSRCADADPTFGSAFDQAVQSMGAGNQTHGGKQVMAMTMEQLNSGMVAAPASMNSAINAPDGSDNTPAGRIFYPEIVLDIMRDSLTADNSDIEQGFNSLISVTTNVEGGVYQQPMINVTAPEGVRNQPIAQGSDPATMIGITASQYTRTIPTKSIALEITDQAARFATIDLVATVIAAQSRGERAAMVDADVGAIINGDTDAGITALVAKKLQDYDAAITGAGEVTQLGFLKMLHDQYQKRSLDSAIMSIDTYYKFEQRANRPTVDKDRGMDDRLNMKFKPMNFSLSDLNILIMDDSLIGANQALFLDSRYALRRVVDVTADYSAVQNFVMRRVSQMRFDYGQHVTPLYTDALQLITLTV